MGRTYSFPPLERERNEPLAKDISALGGFRRQQQRWRRVRRTPRRARTGTRRTPMEGPAGAARRPGYGTVIHKSMTAWPGDLTAWPPAGRLQDRHVRSRQPKRCRTPLVLACDSAGALAWHHSVL